METLLEIGAFVFVIAIITFLRYMRTHDDDQPESPTTMDNEKGEIKPDTIGLMYNTLSTLGCQPVKNDDGSLSVSYQGENFHMEFGGM